MEIPVLETGPPPMQPEVRVWTSLSEAIRLLREQDFGVVLRFLNQAGNHRN
jgi:hypothetical protein